eukprot:15471968-Alexandrium_andersonii.AAC.1
MLWTASLQLHALGFSSGRNHMRGQCCPQVARGDFRQFQNCRKFHCAHRARLLPNEPASIGPNDTGYVEQ